MYQSDYRILFKLPVNCEIVKSYPIALISVNTIPAISAEIGIVMIHAQTRLMVTPQRTADTRLVKPTPIIEPVMVCVVETGIPKRSVSNRVIAPAVSALTP